MMLRCRIGQRRVHFAQEPTTECRRSGRGAVQASEGTTLLPADRRDIRRIVITHYGKLGPYDLVCGAVQHTAAGGGTVKTDRFIVEERGVFPSFVAIFMTEDDPFTLVYAGCLASAPRRVAVARCLWRDAHRRAPWLPEHIRTSSFSTPDRHIRRVRRNRPICNRCSNCGFHRQRLVGRTCARFGQVFQS
jgi:hypothetical protein